ncbi:leucine-rich repeat serine/threonine-protein kinase 2 isoform X2 [Hydra vulgaris]|uniref:leucine-rich repeat serine/threonine-protein kinase 2 isoform X2 n=1 Tax=Hydra vulgaris TaxID=6087 RepID=UPI001F5F1CAB|nr:leucine-rich repeat serine/threonine-protein kinase 2-like isoform X2 [Hydra vulgaris]
MKTIMEFLKNIWKKNDEKDEETLKSTLNVRSGPLGYTILHDAVFSKKPDNVKRILEYGADVNSMSDGRYTPLHIAASIDACNCIEVLLKYNANTKLCDENNKTPYETAVKNNCVNSARLLLSHDILTCLKEKRNDEFKKYVKTVGSERLNPGFYDECLKLAVDDNNFTVIGLIMLRKPLNAKECLIGALKKPESSKSTFILLLCYAVEKHLNDFIKAFFENTDSDKNLLRHLSDLQISAETWHHLKSFISKDQELAYPVCIGCNSMVKNYKGVKYILWNIFCDKENLKADWGGLLLRFLHEDWFKSLTNYKDVILSHNEIKSISSTAIMSYLNAVEKLNLSSNKLQEVPLELFRLPKLYSLNLSSNQLRYLPDIKEWSPFLTTLALDKNLLEGFPSHVEELKLKHLYLANNKLKKVPESICNLKCLETLDISQNVDINSLPANMGKLSKLTNLGLKDLEIKDLPHEYQRPRDILNYLIGKLRNSKPYYKMKLMIIGFPQQGKTTLLKRLKDDTNYNMDQATHGIDIEEITIQKSKKFNFRVWDFAGQEEYFATHQCFLSSSSLYLLVWDVTKKNKFAQLLQPWFENLVARVKFFYIIVVGTKLDLLKRDDIDNACSQMKTEIKTLIENIPAIRNSKYSNNFFSSRLKICFVSLNTKFPSYSKETMTSDGEKNGEKIMGKLFPQVYTMLEEKVNEIRNYKDQNNDLPIIGREEFISLAKSLKCDNDIFQDDDIKPATRFLVNTGTILYFDDVNEGLRDIVFLNPSWICKLMSKFISVDAVHTFVKNGILEQDKIRLILKEELGHQNPDLIKICISLLSRFQVACKIDDHRVLIPPKLPKYNPNHLSINQSSLLIRYYFFSCIPDGFWARFITRFLSMTKEMLSPKPNIEMKPKVSLHGSNLRKDAVDTIYNEDEIPLKINEASSSNIRYVITSLKTNSAISQIDSTQQVSSIKEPLINNSTVSNNVDNLVHCYPIKCVPNNSESSNESKNISSSSSSSSIVSAGFFINSDIKAVAPCKCSSNCNNCINEELNSDCSKKMPNNSHKCLTFISSTDVTVLKNKFNSEFHINREEFKINKLSNENEKHQTYTERIDFEQCCNKDNISNNHINGNFNDDFNNCITNGVYSDFVNGISNDLNNDINNCVDNNGINNSGVNNELNNSINNFVTNAINYNINNVAFKDFDNGINSNVNNDLNNGNNDCNNINGVNYGIDYNSNNYIYNVVNEIINKVLDTVDSYFTKVCKTDVFEQHPINVMNVSEELQSCTILYLETNKNEVIACNGVVKIETNLVVAANENQNEVENINFTDSQSDSVIRAELNSDQNCNISSRSDQNCKISDNCGSSFEQVCEQICDPLTIGHMQMATEMNSVGYFDASMQIVSKQDCEDYNCTNEEKKEESDELESQLINELSNNDEDYEEHFNDYGELAYLLDNGYLSCWNKGIIFNHPQLCFSIQQLPNSFKADRKTIEICVTKSSIGYRVLSYVVDHIRTLLNEWFEGLLMSHNEPHVISSLACPVCTSLGINPPHLFNISTAFQQMLQVSKDCSCYAFCERKHEPRIINITEFCPDLTFQDLPKTMKFNPNDIQCEKNEKCKLGHGQFGKVYNGLCKNKIRAAIKFYNFKMNNSDELSSLLNQFYEIRQEIVMLSNLRHHPYIVQFLGFLLKPELCAVMECASHGALSSVIYDKSKTKVIPRIVKFRICQQIASALVFMHKKCIIHRDIKSDNILLFSLNHEAKINIKLTDFGTANIMSPSGLKTFFGTKGYAAPEMISHKLFWDEYTSSVDIYSFGMVIYELVAFKKPFYHVKELEIDNEVTNGSRPLFYNVPDACYGLVNLTKLMITMWNQEPSKRPNANDVLNTLSSTFQLIFGYKRLASGEYPRELCYITSSKELWITSEDKKDQSIIVINMESFEVVKKIELYEDMKRKFNISFITPIGDKHVCVLLRSRNDVILVYKTKGYSFLRNYEIKNGFIRSISANKDWICLGFDDGHCSKVTLNNFLNGRMLKNSHLIGKKSNPISSKKKFPVTTSVLLSETFIWSSGYSFKYCNLNESEDKKKVKCFEDIECKVKDIVFSFDEKLFFISFHCSPEIQVYKKETKGILHTFSCRDDILRYSPNALNIDLRVTCLCSVSDMLWVGTGSGHILIYKVYDVDRFCKLLQALHPYKIEVRKLLLVELTQTRNDGVKHIVVSIGKELNKNAFGLKSFFEFNVNIPKDQTAINKKIYTHLDDKDGKVIIFWHVLQSHQYKNLVLS